MSEMSDLIRPICRLARELFKLELERLSVDGGESEEGESNGEEMIQHGGREQRGDDVIGVLSSVTINCDRSVTLEALPQEMVTSAL